MPEVTLVPLTDQGRALLDALDAAAGGVPPFRTSDDGRRPTPPTPTRSRRSSTGCSPTGREHVARQG